MRFAYHNSARVGRRQTGARSVHETRPLNLMRARAGAERVTNVELF